jgi:hypothetical protein
MTDRKDYIEALRREREHVAKRNDSPAEIKARQAQIDAELSFYSDQPDVRVIETAVPGPFSRGRAVAARNTKK